MTEDSSGVLWLIIDVVAVLVVAAAIVYGIVPRRKRLSAGTKVVRKQGTKDMYDNPKGGT